MSKEEFYGSVGNHTSGDQVPATAATVSSTPVSDMADAGLTIPQHKYWRLKQENGMRVTQEDRPQVEMGADDARSAEINSEMDAFDKHMSENPEPEKAPRVRSSGTPISITITKPKKSTTGTPGLGAAIRTSQEERNGGGYLRPSIPQTYGTRTLREAALGHISNLENWFKANHTTIVSSGDEEALSHYAKGLAGLHVAKEALDRANGQYSGQETANGLEAGAQGNGHLVAAVKAIQQAHRHFGHSSIANLRDLDDVNSKPAPEVTVIDKKKGPVTFTADKLRLHTEGELRVPNPNGKVPKTSRLMGRLMDHNDPYTSMALHRIDVGRKAGDSRFRWLDDVMDKINPSATPKGAPAWGPGEGVNRSVSEQKFPRGVGAGLPGEAVLSGTKPPKPGVGVADRLAAEAEEALKGGERSAPNVAKPLEPGEIKPEVQQSVRDMNELLEKSGETHRIEESPEVTEEQNKKLRGKVAQQKTVATEVADTEASKKAAEKANNKGSNPAKTASIIKAITKPQKAE